MVAVENLREIGFGSQRGTFVVKWTNSNGSAPMTPESLSVKGIGERRI